MALAAAALVRPFARFAPASLRALLELAPRRRAGAPGARARRSAGSAHSEPAAPRKRVALLTGCVQTVIAPEINEATMRLLQRCGVEVVAIGGCCGALVHHLGKERRANALAAALVEQLHVEMDGQGLDAIVANASGCGTHVKDFGYLFRDDAQLAAKAAAVSAKARDVTELLAELGLPPAVAGAGNLTVAYHSACSMQHGQKIERPPRTLLAAAGYEPRGDRGRASLLRLCGYLQRPSARARDASARSQGRSYRAHGRGRRRHR